jgi:heme O synthase-like polyprenyltransferase
MTTKTAAIMIMFGFLLTFGAVGGMEDPSKADYFLEQIIVAIVGLALAVAGALALNNSEYYDER